MVIRSIHMNALCVNPWLSKLVMTPRMVSKLKSKELPKAHWDESKDSKILKRVVNVN